MKINQKIRSSCSLLILLIGAGLFTSGCSSLPGQKQTIPAKTYLLELPDDAGQKHTIDTESCLTLLVSQTQSGPGFDTNRIAYQRKDFQLEYFAYHQWVDTPANMLMPILTQALQNSGMFSAIVDGTTLITTDFRLESEVLALQHNFEGNSSVVNLKLRVVLFHRHDKKIVANHVFSVTEPAPEDTPYGAVVAANHAVARFLHELMAFMGKNIEDYTLQCQ